MATADSVHAQKAVAAAKAAVGSPRWRHARRRWPQRRRHAWRSGPPSKVPPIPAVHLLTQLRILSQLLLSFAGHRFGIGIGGFSYADSFYGSSFYGYDPYYARYSTIQATLSFSSQPCNRCLTMRIRVIVPEADAKVWSTGP
jgi:hypothetical protein